MHRDKTLARILLILSVVHVAAAAPAIARQRSLDVDEDVTAASEKRGNSGTPQDSYPVPQMDDGPPPASGAPHLYNDPPPASGTLQLDNDPPPASGAPHDPPPASGAPHDPPPASGAQHDPPPASGTAQLDDDPQPASGASHLHNNPPLALETPQLHGDSLTASEPSSVHDAPPFEPDSFDESYRYKDVHYPPPLHESDAPLHESDAPLHESDAPLHESNAPLHESDRPAHNLYESNTPLHESETPPTYDHRFSYETWPHARPTDNFISDGTKAARMHLGVLAFAAGIVGLGIGLHIRLNQQSKHNGRDLTSSSDVVGRGVSTHPRPPRILLSRALANLRNEDLRLLSVLNSRAFERLD